MGNLESLPPIDGSYFFFVGENQKSIHKSLVLASKENEVEWIQICGNGKNALDFHLVYYLAKKDSESDAVHYILSKDKGFDPLISFVNKDKGKEIVQRIVNLDDIIKENYEVESKCRTVSNYDKVKKNLSNIQKGKRPKSERTLQTHICTLLKNGTSTEDDIRSVINDLYRNGDISNGRLSYSI